MEVHVISQCDAVLGGGRKALFPGQRYDLPDAEAEALIATGKVRAMGSVTDIRIVGKPQGKRRTG